MMAAALLVIALAATAAATGWVREALLRHAVLDRPNERSSHSMPTPRGGGIAVIGTLAVLAAALPALGIAVAPGHWLVLACLLLLAALGWIDDLRGLSAAARFPIQAACVLAGLSALPEGAVFQGLLPFWLDRALAALAWLWFVNLYNFMDGIDGISGAQTAAIGSGLALVAVTGGDGYTLAVAAVLIGAALGFLRWNWHPARIFLGDVGSVPLGFLIGWLLLAQAAQGRWGVALILPLYYLADATVTLLRRLARGEKVWQAHREHFYQQAVRGVGDHARVVALILAVDAVLVALALAPDAASAAAAAFVLVGLLLFRLRRMGGSS
jgi:UDP-N-acetylmuramyl pentapeptide phosphotransferase/UDP-N-acetylglucosamine-1-phosphate transferase